MNNFTKSKLGVLLLLITIICLSVQNIYLRQNQINRNENFSLQKNNQNEIPYHSTSVFLHNDTKERMLTKHVDVLKIYTTKSTFVRNAHAYTAGNKSIACMTFNGRIGNLMFKYAFLHVMSKIKNLYPIFPEDFELSRYFNLPQYESQEQSARRQECNTVVREAERWPCSYDEKFFKLSKNKRVYFHGYFQSWKYWRQYEDEIRELFTFKTDIQDEAQEKLSAILYEMGFKDTSEDVVIGIHSRRGDYVSKPAKNYGYITPNETYYLNAMTYFRERFKTKRVFFIVASNEIEWLKQKLHEEENISFLHDNAPIIDMAILSLCNHVIMSSGTFGWWAGWMTRGTVVYYNHLYTPGSLFSSAFRGGDTSDFIYPGWVGLM